MNSAWLLWLGLYRLGYDEQVWDLAGRLAGAATGAGLREYYNPLSGVGMGAVDFGWSALLMEMVAPDLPAPQSYVANGID